MIAMLLSIFTIYTFNRLPERCLSDYDAEPKEMLFPRAQTVPLLGTLFLLYVLCLSFCYSIEVALPDLFLHMLILVIFIHIVLSDQRFLIIPDEHVALLSLLGLLYWGKQGQFTLAAQGLLIGVGIMLAASLLSGITKRDLIGFGDLKLFAALGALSGVTGMYFIFFYSTVICSLHLFSSLLLRKVSMNSEVPLAPYLFVGYLCYNANFLIA